jgi:hypothetical protein
MKKLLGLFLLGHGCHLAFAGNWAPLSEIKAQDIKKVFAEKSECEQLGPCEDITGVKLDEVKTVEVDDTLRPKFIKDKLISCADQADCKTKLQDQTCDAGDFAVINENYTEVYCAKQDGFHKKDGFVNDEDKIAAKQEKQSLDSKTDQGYVDMEKGRRIIALVAGVIKSKKLTTAQRKAYVKAMQDLIILAHVGSLDAVKEEIENLPTDAVLTEEFKQLVLKEL